MLVELEDICWQVTVHHKS